MIELRTITAEEVIEFVRTHPSKYRTIAQNVRFRAEPWRDGIIFWINQDTRNEGCHPERLKRYVEIFNRERTYETGPYRQFFLKSYFLAVVRQMQIEKLNGAQLLSQLSREEREVLEAPPTEREELRKSRLGQGRFRRDVIKLRKACFVTKLQEIGFLRASHIKPWSESTNEERLDPYNGLLLCPNYDHLFDAAYISFRDDGRILVSPKLPQAIIDLFGIDHSFRANRIDKKTKRYLAHHRTRYRRHIQ